jgi:hypothetical protein
MQDKQMTSSNTNTARIIQLRAPHQIMRTPFRCADCNRLTKHTDSEHLGRANCDDCHELREYCALVARGGVAALAQNDYYDAFCHIERAKDQGGDPLRIGQFADLERLITVYQAARGYCFKYR